MNVKYPANPIIEMMNYELREEIAERCNFSRNYNGGEFTKLQYGKIARGIIGIPSVEMKAGGLRNCAHLPEKENPNEPLTGQECATIVDKLREAST